MTNHILELAKFLDIRDEIITVSYDGVASGAALASLADLPLDKQYPINSPSGSLSDYSFIMKDSSSYLLKVSTDGLVWETVGADQTVTALGGCILSVRAFDFIGALMKLDGSAVKSSGKTVTVDGSYSVLKGVTTVNVNASTATIAMSQLEVGSKCLVRKLSVYNSGSTVTITPPSGATFEGLSEYLLYEQYSSVTLERISSTVFAIQDEKINKLSEVGEIKPFASTVPKGFKACDGSAISRATFPALFSAIGTTFGAGDGSTTFNLPDLRETVLVGTGTRGAGVTAHDTYTLGQFKDDQMQGHRHDVYDGVSTGGTAKGPSSSMTTYQRSLSALSGYSVGDPISDGDNGTPRTGSTTHGKQMGINYAIRYA